MEEGACESHSGALSVLSRTAELGEPSLPGPAAPSDTFALRAGSRLPGRHRASRPPSLLTKANAGAGHAGPPSWTQTGRAHDPTLLQVDKPSCDLGP